MLLVAFKELVEHFPKAKLVIAGSGEEESNLKKLAHSLGIMPGVDFLGKVDEAQKVNLLQKAWVLVNPSYMEGWGITTIEANACGTPVVASNVPGLCESVINPHTGYLVEPENPHILSQKIAHILTNHSLRKKMSTHALEWAQNFTWQSSAQKSLKLLTGEREIPDQKDAGTQSEFALKL